MAIHLAAYDWQLAPEADKHLHHLIDWFIERCPQTDQISTLIERVTSTRFFDWIDHIALPEDLLNWDELARHGFVEQSGAHELYLASGTNLFPLRFHDAEVELAIKVDDVDAFRSAWSLQSEVEGDRFAPFRRLCVLKCKGAVLSAIERRGYSGFEVLHSDDDHAYADALSELRSRKRDHPSDEIEIQAIEGLVAELRSKLDPSRLADAFARSEIDYWQSRNSAARMQRTVQDELGLGWANHDHLTFRSSRTQFHRLIRLLEIMDFRPRERFYAGAAAGWGAQIMENPLASRVAFADVDLAPKENSGDFAHRSLPELNQLGTVGLWVAIHGESVARAGMHHMAIGVDFERARGRLAKGGVESMAPFSAFDFLKQSFTLGERWPVDRERLARLQGSRIKDRSKMVMFENGAIGSHLELTQRAGGFKGFNQDSVSAIIKATNPLTYRETQA